MYKISIILPVYNVEDKIENAFKSILNQSFGFENLEVIFVDDCSTDNSMEIIKNFVDSYENVKYFCLSENSGYAGKPRNVGIMNATSDYLMFLDPDDIYLEDACEVLYHNIHDSNLDFVSANYIQYRQGRKFNFNWKNLYGIDLEGNEIQIKDIHEEPNLYLCPPSIWTKIVKRDFVLKNDIGFPIGVPGQDLVFFAHCLLKANGIKFVDIPVVQYMPENQSVTSNKNMKLLSGYITAYYILYDLLKDYDELVKFSVYHLQYWTMQVCFSDLNERNKLALLKFAYPLFEVYKSNADFAFQNKYLSSFFDDVYNKNFYEAIKLSEKIAVNYEDYFDVSNSIKEKKFVFMVNNDNIGDDIFKIAELLNTNDYNVILFNTDELNIFHQIKEFKEFKRLINIYEFYTNKSYLGHDLFNYDYIEDGDTIIVHDEVYDFYLTFNDKIEWINHFILELCIILNEKIFLITDSYKINLDSNLVYYVNVAENELDMNLTQIEELFKNIYLKDLKSKYQYQDYIIKTQSKNEKLIKKNKKLKNKNKKLTKDNEKLHDLISEFKSRKIIKMVDKLKNLI